MKILDANKLGETLAHNSVPRKALVKTGDSQTKLQTVNDARLEPGKGFEPHNHTDCEEVYYFLEGRGEMTIDKKTIPVATGICILVQPGESHGLKNTGNTSIRFITIRVKV